MRAEDAAEERILDAIIPPSRDAHNQPIREENTARQNFRKRLRERQIDDMEIEIAVANTAQALDIMGPPGMEEMTEQLRSMFAGIQRDNTKPQKITVRNAFKLLVEEEAAKRVNEEEIRNNAIQNAEQNGIVFFKKIVFKTF